MADVAAPRTDDVSEDGFLGGKLLLRQLRSGHRAGHDAILLAASTKVQSGNRVVEFGSGVGAAGLALARRVQPLDLVLVEIDPQLAALARSNAEANGLSAQVLLLDVCGGSDSFVAAGLPPDSVDAVLMNPPFNHPGRHRASPDPKRSIAHVAEASTLEVWLHAARRVLKSGGILTLIWRADGLAEVLAALGRGFGSVAVQPVHGSAGGPAIRVLVRAVKGGRAPLAIWPGLELNTASQTQSEFVQAVLAGADVLPLAK
ncbi:tRNA1(Val) (adenine(37)-N6)-methyltransferase [Rhodopseudomonas sp. B29]|uniref:tRNA1(Val) (adenine(37)-N6)-methyltransferase n=1 Tax=Rhodopseudomonas sp. B29 TaxID=95607 RepID=UPI00034A135A|nr:methyltransferase [Rhodopseudomonas sp. B29]